MLTFLPLEEVAAIERSMQQDPGYAPNAAQRRLAEEVTRWVHGEEGLQQALKATEALAPGAGEAAAAAYVLAFVWVLARWLASAEGCGLPFPVDPPSPPSPPCSHHARRRHPGGDCRGCAQR